MHGSDLDAVNNLKNKLVQRLRTGHALECTAKNLHTGEYAFSYELQDLPLLSAPRAMRRSHHQHLLDRSFAQAGSAVGTQR